MNKLQELINELCPDGVEYRKTSELCIDKFWLMPATPKYIEKGIPYLTSKNIKNNQIDFENVNYISEDDYMLMTKSRAINKGDLLITMIGTIGEAAFVKTTNQFYGQNLYLLRLNSEVVVPMFYYYYLTSRKVKEGLISKKNPSSQGYIKAGSIDNLLIPVPPLPVQEEIVRILDKMTGYVNELKTELEAELKTRKMQYQYYLDKLIWSSTDNVVELSSLGTLIRGKRFVHADATDGGVPCIHYGELYTYYGVYTDIAKSHIREELRPKMRYASKGDVVIVGAGENNEDIGVGVAWFGDEEIAVHDACYTLKHNQNPKYISYYLRTTKYHQQIKKYVSEGKICSISAQGLGKSLIPLPNINVQNDIVSKLDKFYALCSDIKVELSAEIQARQKQYEYYRDKLLSFKETSHDSI